MIKIFLSVLVSLSSTQLLASNMDTEISHLLDFVAKTECQYERNGTRYNGKKAAQHIQNKYDYFKDEINTTEIFIELSATKSTMSGKFYKIICNGALPVKSKDWLLQELKLYRSNLGKY